MLELKRKDQQKKQPSGKFQKPNASKPEESKNPVKNQETSLLSKKQLKQKNFQEKKQNLMKSSKEVKSAKAESSESESEHESAMEPDLLDDESSSEEKTLENDSNFDFNNNNDDESVDAEPVVSVDEEYSYECVELKPTAEQMAAFTENMWQDKPLNGSWLSWMIAPMTEEQFFSEIWEKKCLFIKRHAVASKYYKGLFSRENLNSIVKNPTADNKEASPVEFTTDIDIAVYRNGKRETLNPDGEVSVSQLNKFYDKGCSIRMLRPQKYSNSMWKLLSGLEDEFQNVVGANCYLTPPNSQGFAPHFDDIEAFVLQTEGSKRWKLHSNNDDNSKLCTFSSSNFESDDVSEPFFDQVVETGDLLYFPRGMIHQACTTSTHSLHVTVSTGQNNNWGEYIQEVLKLGTRMTAHSSLAMRKSVPKDMFKYMGFVNSESEDLRREDFKDVVVSLLGNIVENLPFDIAADQRMRAFLRDRLPPYLSATEIKSSQSDQHISGQTKIKLVRPSHMRVLCENGNAVIYHSIQNKRGYREIDEQSVEFGSDFGPALEFLFESYPNFVSLSDLPELEEEDQMDFCQALMDNNFLILDN